VSQEDWNEAFTIGFIAGSHPMPPSGALGAILPVKLKKMIPPLRRVNFNVVNPQVMPNILQNMIGVSLGLFTSPPTIENSQTKEVIPIAVTIDFAVKIPKISLIQPGWEEIIPERVALVKI